MSGKFGVKYFENQMIENRPWWFGHLQLMVEDVPIILVNLNNVRGLGRS